MAIENKYFINDSSSLLPDFRYKGKSKVDLSKILEKAKTPPHTIAYYKYDSNSNFYDNFLNYDSSLDYFNHSYISNKYKCLNSFEFQYGFHGFYPKFTNSLVKSSIIFTSWSSYSSADYTKLEGNCIYKFIHDNKSSNKCWKNYHFFLIKKIDSDPNKIGIYDSGEFSPINLNTITHNGLKAGTFSTSDRLLPPYPDFDFLMQSSLVSTVDANKINDKNIINLLIIAAGGAGGKSAYSYGTSGGGGGSGGALLLSLDLTKLDTVYDAFLIAIGPKGKGTQYYKIESSSDDTTYAGTSGCPCYVTKINMNASNMYQEPKYMIPGGTFGTFGYSAPETKALSFPTYIFPSKISPTQGIDPSAPDPSWAHKLGIMPGKRGSYSNNGSNPNFVTQNDGLKFTEKVLYENDLTKYYSKNSVIAKSYNYTSDPDFSRNHETKYTTGAPGFCSSGGKAYKNGNPNRNPSNYIYTYTGSPATGYGAGGGGGWPGSNGDNLGGDGGPAAMFIYY